MAKVRSNRVTLKDVAARVGVSAMTVSRALAGKSKLVSPGLLERIRLVSRELGYMPNLAARSLRGEHLPTIVVLAEHLASHQYLAELMDRATRGLEGQGYGVITCQSAAGLLQALRQFHLAGAMLLAPPEELFYDTSGKPTARFNIAEPTLIIHCAVEQDVMNEISPDLADGAYQAASHLLQLRHRRIGFLGGPDAAHESHWFAKRRIGIERALAEHGLPKNRLAFQGCYHADHAGEALKALLANRDITAIIGLNDEIAVAAIRAAQDAGLNVPGDLSVIGGNDISVARFFRPALTTVAIDVPALVDAGLKLLMSEISARRTGRAAKPVKVLQKCRLIVRDSTAPRAGD